MAPDFVNDLKTLREQQGLGLEDVHEKTRIPVDVLKRFESGHLLSDPTYSDVYIRAFLKSYAAALDKSPRRVLVAYEAHRTGNYVGGLVGETGEPQRPKPTPRKHEEETGDFEAADRTEDDDATRKKEIVVEKRASTESAGPVEALSQREEEPKREVHAAPMVRTAQNFPRRPVQRQAPDHSGESANWLSVFGLLAGLIIVLGGLIWYLFYYAPADQQEDSQAAVAEEVATGTETEESEPAAPRLSIPIRITVTAGGDGLQNFRVTELPNERLGHWIEAGDQMTFESDSLVILWGEGANGLAGEATLELQGFMWAPAEGSILRIDPQRGQRLLDSLHAAATAG